MRCPKCGRQTRPRLRGEAKDVGERAGILQAATSEGYCFRDYAPTVGPPRDGVRQRVRVIPYREEVDVQAATRSLLNYYQSRQSRGVPREGFHESVLVKPGMFLMEVR